VNLPKPVSVQWLRELIDMAITARSSEFLVRRIERDAQLLLMKGVEQPQMFWLVRAFTSFLRGEREECARCADAAYRLAQHDCENSRRRERMPTTGSRPSSAKLTHPTSSRSARPSSPKQAYSNPNQNKSNPHSSPLINTPRTKSRQCGATPTTTTRAQAQPARSESV
jgi:hypothetical protein